MMKVAVYFVLVVVLSLWCSIPGFALTEEAKATPTPETPPESSESTAEEKLDINTASLQELLLIPDLGEEQVLAIMNGRPYEPSEGNLQENVAKT